MDLIGPHEGREFALLDSGQKHVALFYETIPNEVEAFRARPEFSVIDFTERFDASGRVTLIPYVILFRKGHEAAAHELRTLIRQGRARFDPVTERRIGQILGYPPEAIEHYLACWPSGTAPRQDATGPTTNGVSA